MNNLPIIALISPNGKATSETFITIHKNRLEGKLYFLFGGFRPTQEESFGPLSGKPLSLIGRLVRRLTISKRHSPLYSFLKKKKVQIVFAEFGPTGVNAISDCKELNIPLIVHFHGFDAFSKSTLLTYGEAYKDLFEYSSYIIAVSKKMVEKLVDLGANREKILYTPCGPNSSFSNITPDFNSNTFVSIGRFVDKKAPYLTLAAFKLVHDKFPNTKLIFAGNGSLYGDVPMNDLTDVCKNLCNLWGLEKVVSFMGPVSHEDVVKLMSQSFCYVQHSITPESGDSEGTPVSVLEASLASLPVISTVHGGIPDVIINGETGYLVNERDVERMADHMLKLLRDKDLARQMGAMGRQNIINNFSIDRHVSILNKAILQAVQNRPS